LPSQHSPAANISQAATNLAADVLLCGQGNSGTILSHFYIELAEAGSLF
jgi:dihydroxyacetone kinase-like predicted kinase